MCYLAAISNFSFIIHHATVAQMVEQLIRNERVGGSSPFGGS